MSPQGRSMRQMSRPVGNSSSRGAVRRARSAGYFEKLRKSCIQGLPPQPSLCEAKCVFSHDLRMVTSGADGAPLSRERLPSTTVSTSCEMRRSAVHAHCPPSLAEQYKREKPGGAASTWMTQQGEARPSKASRFSLQRSHTEIVHQEDVDLPAYLSSDSARPEAANASKHGSSQYQCAQRGFVIGYSSPAHILKQRARSHAVLGLAQVVNRGEGPSAAPILEFLSNNESFTCQNGLSAQTSHADRQHQAAPRKRLHREEQEEDLFHTLRHPGIPDVGADLRAGAAGKSAVPVRLRSPSNVAGDLQVACSSSSSKLGPDCSHMQPGGDRNGIGEVREVKSASLYTDGTCRGDGGPTATAKRISARTAETYTGSSASLRIAQLTENSETAAQRTKPSVKVSRSGVDNAAAHSTGIDRKMTNTCVSSTVLKGPRSSEIPLRAISRLKEARVKSHRGCVQEHVFSVKKATVQRETQPPTTLELSSDHSSVNRRGKSLRVLPSSPLLAPKGVGGRALHRVCKTTTSGVQSISHSLPSQKITDSASPAPFYIKPSLLPTFFKSKINRVEEAGQPRRNVLQDHVEPEASRVTLPSPQLQTASSDHTAPCVGSQITEHSWMFPRDEYRPPLSPHIPFNLDEDEDATASALLVNLTEELRPPKGEHVREGDYGDARCQVRRHLVTDLRKEDGRCQRVYAGASPCAAVSRSGGSSQTRSCTAQIPSNCQEFGGLMSGCGRSTNVEDVVIVDGGNQIGLSQSGKLPTTAECLSGFHCASSQAGGRPHTPLTDWCTTMSTAWISSSATATENLHHASTTPGCGGKDFEFLMKTEATGASKTSNHPTYYDNGREQSVPHVAAASDSVPASSGDPSTPSNGNPAIHSDCTLASHYFKENRGSCLRLAEARHTLVSTRVNLERDPLQSFKDNIEGGGTAGVMREILVQPYLQPVSEGKRGVEFNETDQHHGAPFVAAKRAAYSGFTSILGPDWPRKEICHSLSDDAAYLQQQPSQGLYQCMYRSSRTHPSIAGSGHFDRANAFARRNQFSVPCATKGYSGHRCLDSTQQPDLSAWQTTENEVEPFAPSSQHSESIQGSTDYLEDESTTSDDCSSDYTSEDTSTSSPLLPTTESPQRNARPSCRSLKGTSSKKALVSQCHTSVHIARVRPGERAAPEVLLRARDRLQEANLVGRTGVQSQDPQFWLQHALRDSGPAASAIKEVAKDLAVARMLSGYQQTESSTTNRLPEKLQDSTLVIRRGSPRPTNSEDKGQPSLRGQRRWRLWGWTFGPRRYANCL